MQIGDNEWFLELWAPEGVRRDQINVNEIKPDYPSGFRERVDTGYISTLKEKLEVLEGEPVIDHGGERYEEESIQWENDKLKLGGKALVPGSLKSRPVLRARKTENGEEKIEKVFWDGKTSVLESQATEKGLSFRGYQGTYAERLTASESVDEFPVDDLPLSMNISVAHLLESSEDDEKVVPVFYRSEEVAEYPNYHHVVAGGIPDIHMPLDAGWMESGEEIRVLPEVGRDSDEAENKLRGRNIIGNQSVKSGRMEEREVYLVTEEDGISVYPTAPDEMELIGIARNLESHTPEIMAMVETDIPYEVVEENYRRGAEHADVRPVSVSEIGSFLDQEENIIPVGEALLRLVQDRYGEDSMEEYSVDLTDTPYEEFTTEII